jgi:hypothetical protein
MKSKKIIIDKTTYGGTLVDKYFLIFDDGTDEQVNYGVWDQFEVGDEYIVADVPDSFDEAMKDIVKGKTVPLDKALNEKPSFNWKEAHDLQQKLVVHYVLENEKLKDRIKELEAPSKKVDKICKQIEEIYKENERLKDDLELYKKVNLDLRKELTMTEKLIELNMKDLWDIADQRDWYYEEYRKLKDKV